MSTPAHTPLECSAVFDPKQHDPHAPPSLFTGSHPKHLFFVVVSLMKRVLKKKHFANVEEVKQTKRKKAEALKRHQNQQVQKLL